MPATWNGKRRMQPHLPFSLLSLSSLPFWCPPLLLSFFSIPFLSNASFRLLLHPTFVSFRLLTLSERYPRYMGNTSAYVLFLTRFGLVCPASPPQNCSVSESTFFRSLLGSPSEWNAFKPTPSISNCYTTRPFLFCFGTLKINVRASLDPSFVLSLSLLRA